jgi:hypothetical protein
MHPRRLSAALFIASLILITGIATGCGGGTDQSQGDGGAQQQDGDGGQPSEASAPKIALGSVARVDTEKSRIALRPSSDVQGEGPISFKVKPKAKITLDDQEAELADAKKGQQAHITYVVKRGRNMAREVALISEGGSSPAGGDNTA